MFPCVCHHRHTTSQRASRCIPMINKQSLQLTTFSLVVFSLLVHCSNVIAIPMHESMDIDQQKSTDSSRSASLDHQQVSSRSKESDEFKLELLEMVSRLQTQVIQLQEQRATDSAQLKTLKDTVSRMATSEETSTILRRLDSQIKDLKSEMTSLAASKEREVDRLADVRDLRMEVDSVHSECQKLRADVQGLKDRREDDVRLMGQQRNNQVTVKWLQKSVEEIRKEIKELAAVQNVSAAIRQQQQFETGLTLLRSDVVALRTQLEETRVNQDKDEATLVQVQQDVVDLTNQNHQMGANSQLFREELSQFKDELLTISNSIRKNDFGSSVVVSAGGKQETGADAEKPKKKRVKSKETEKDIVTVDLGSFFNPVNHHRLRHHGKVRVELEEVRSVLGAVYRRQSTLEEQFRQIRHNHSVIDSNVRHVWGRIGDILNGTRLKAARQALMDRAIKDLRKDLTVLERSVTQSNKVVHNLSDTVTGIDKLHSSTVQLFEALEGLEDKYGQRLGDLQKEVSKFEFNMAQLTSTVSILKEDENNHYDALKATRADIATLRQESQNGKYKMAALRSELIGNEASRLLYLADGSVDSRPAEHVASAVDRQRSLESVLAQLDARLVQQSHLLNETVAKVGHKADLEHIAHWATSADQLDDKINKLTQRIDMLQERMAKDEEGLNSVYRQFPVDCSAMSGRPSGVYEIYPPGAEAPIKVFCDMDSDGGGWTVIQKRQDNGVDFDRDWDEYKRGFGDVASNGHGDRNGNFWLGNEHLHRLTSSHDMTVRFDLWDEDGRYRYAQYDRMAVDDEANLYRLHISDRFSGNVSNAMSYHDGMPFSTRDADHDQSSLQCAQQYQGGWWYDHCQHVNVNGRYNIGLTWYDSDNNSWIEVARIEIKMRPALKATG